MSQDNKIRLFLTQPQPCGYLPEQHSQSLCIDPLIPLDDRLLGALSRQGFRRSGSLVYRPHCQDCSACVPVRIPVHDFQPSRSQRRTWQRGQRLSVSEHSPALTDEHYQLYDRYIRARHADGSMFPPSPAQFKDFLAQTLPFSRFFEFRLNGVLKAVAVTDLLPDGLSAVYSFYAPDDQYFSLGRYTVLWQVEESRRRGLPYLYLGYWIAASRKMNYKTDYRPLEGYQEERWQLLHE